MKKSSVISVVFISVLVITAVILNQASGQGSKETAGKPIPENVSKILQKSCANCHAEPGNGMALAHMNITKWDKYTPEKQASKAKAICEQVTKEKMPPRRFKDSHPDAVPTNDDLKIITDWANSLQPEKK